MSPVAGFRTRHARLATSDSSRRSAIPTSGSIQRGSRLRLSGRPVSVNRPEGPADDVSS